MAHFVGIEIGGTKLQLAVGTGEGPPFQALVRDTVASPGTAAEIQRQIVAGFQRLLAEARLSPAEIAGIGIGFGGPVDSQAGTIVTSHQVEGWNGFRIVDWLQRETGRPVVLHNDADSAAFAEAMFGAGRGFDPVLYVTVTHVLLVVIVESLYHRVLPSGQEALGMLVGLLAIVLLEWQVPQPTANPPSVIPAVHSADSPIGTKAPSADQP